jgi:hypothetical protein
MPLLEHRLPRGICRRLGNSQKSARGVEQDPAAGSMIVQLAGSAANITAATIGRAIEPGISSRAASSMRPLLI